MSKILTSNNTKRGGTRKLPYAFTEQGIYHDWYIFIDHRTKNEMIFHCGGSSKDGGKRVSSITKVNDVMLYRDIIDNLDNFSPPLNLLSS